MDTAESGYVLDSAALVAPVTALEFVGEEYLLTGKLFYTSYTMNRYHLFE